jgi:hypothetical protein
MEVSVVLAYPAGIHKDQAYSPTPISAMVSGSGTAVTAPVNVWNCALGSSVRGR